MRATAYSTISSKTSFLHPVSDIPNSACGHPEQNPGQTIVWWCLLAATLINLFCNAFSPFFIPEGALDPDCFYAEGCAVIHGHLPYRDFLDVKGPFLFLIYTIGYLLTPTRCEGIFLLYTLAAWGTLYAFFRTAELFRLPPRGAVLATALAACCLYSRVTSFWAAQPELLMAFPFSWMLYYLTAFLQYPTDNRQRRLAFWLSGGATITFLIKYNFVLPYAAAFCVVIYYVAKRREYHQALTFTLRCFGWALLICIPFAIYFTYHGLWNDFFYAYVTLNMQSNAHTPEWANGFNYALIKKLAYTVVSMSCFVIIHAVIITCSKKSNPEYRRVISHLLIVFLATFLSCFIGLYGYYYIMMAPTTIFLCSQIAGSRVVGTFLRRFFPLTIASAFLLLIFLVNGYCIGPRGWGRPTAEARKIAQVQEIIATIKKPSIIYIKCPDILLGRTAASVPGTPAWMELPGVAQETYQQRDSDIATGKVDFVVTCSRCEAQDERRLVNNGYKSLKEAKIDTLGTLKNIQVWAAPHVIAHLNKEREAQTE